MTLKKLDLSILQDGIYLLFNFQCETSVIRVSLEGPRKKAIIMRIPFITAYSFRSPGPGG